MKFKKRGSQLDGRWDQGFLNLILNIFCKCFATKNLFDTKNQIADVHLEKM